MDANKHEIVVPVQMDTAVFRDFAVFDTLYRQRRWISPTTFCSILLMSSVICFSQTGRQGAILLGTVLLIVALVLPAVYFGMFFHSVNQQAKNMKLQTPRQAYRLCLTDAADGISVSNPGEFDKPEKATRLAWDGMYGAWRTDAAIYLYAQPNRAYILPVEQIQGGADALWQLCIAMIPAEKCHNRTKK